jgi:hypothetical protein
VTGTRQKLEEILDTVRHSIISEVAIIEYSAA